MNNLKLALRWLTAPIWFGFLLVMSLPCFIPVFVGWIFSNEPIPGNSPEDWYHSFIKCPLNSLGILHNLPANTQWFQ